MESSLKTVYCNYLQLCKARNAPFKAFRFSTLNEKFGVHAEQPVRNGQYPELSFMTIGVGGHRDDGSGVISEVYHSPKHASLYDHIPFIMRPLDNDLPLNQQGSYRLRVIEEFGGTKYASYFAKKLPSLTSPNLYATTVERTGITARAFIPDQLDLFPTPILTLPDFTQEHKNYVIAADGISFVLTTTEVQEIIDAHNIRTGGTTPAIISEIGICSGIDDSFDRTYGPAGAEITDKYTDVHNLQINYFINVYYLLGDLLNAANTAGEPNAVEKFLQIGTSEPVLEY